MLNNNNVQIAMLELSDQNRAVLDFYFNSTGSKLFTVVDKAKADAFIIDYDYPGAHTHVEELLNTHNKPIVLLSVKEQELDKTIWIAKPLTADALTKAADKLQQIIAVKEVSIPDVQVTETVTAEVPAAEIEVVETKAVETKNNEAVAVTTTETPMLEESLSHDDNSDIFDVLEEDEHQDENFDNNKKIEARLAGAGAAALVSATLSSKNEAIDENIKSAEESHLEFASILLESEVALDVEPESEDEIDALLEALIKGEGNKAQKETVDTESDESDIFRDNLSLDAELESNTAEERIIEDAIQPSLDEVVLEDSQLVDASSKTSQLEETQLETPPLDTEINDIDLLAEGIVVEEDINPLVEEKESVLLEENFTLHDDLDPSEEDVYAETLEVNYADLKAEKTETVTSSDKQTETIDIEIESHEESIQEEFNLNTDLQGPLETGLFNFDLESSENTEVEEATAIKKSNDDIEDIQDIEDIESTLLNSVVDDESINDLTSLDSNDDNFDNNIDTDLDSLLQEVSVETEEVMHDDLDPSEEDVDAKTIESIENTEAEVATASIESNDDIEDIELTLLDSVVDNESINDLTNLDSNDDNFDNNIDTDLDSLLQEVSVGTEEVIEETPQNVTEVASFITETQSIEDDFDTKDEPAPVSENDTDFNLQSLLNEVREEASGETEDDTHSGISRTLNQTNAEKRWLQMCGNNTEISAQKDVAKLSFTLKNHLLGVLLKQIDEVKGSEQLYRLKYDDLIIVLDHSQNSIYCNLPITNDEYSDFCFSEIEPNKFKIYDLDYSEVRLYRKKMKDNPDRAHTIESFIWSTSLLTSRGRLPHDTVVTKSVALKAWPNLTRVELMPNAIQIAAVFSKHPGSLLEIPNWIGVKQRYVFAFYNAALSLGILELDSSKIKKSSFSFGKKGSKNKSEERSFFGRLLQRLKS